MRTTEPVLSPPISSAANTTTATANVVMTFPGTIQQFPPPPKRNGHSMTAIASRTSLSGLAITTEAIP
jgi:hypothetical protein